MVSLKLTARVLVKAYGEQHLELGLVHWGNRQRETLADEKQCTEWG